MKALNVRPLKGMVVGVGAALLGAWSIVSAQPAAQSPLSPPPNGPRHADPTWHALTNATVHVSPEKKIEKATVVIRDGRIVAVGADAPTAGARVWDCAGLHIYAGFIDAYVDVTVPKPDANAPGLHWNTHVMPQRSVLDGTGVDERTGEALRRLGFTAAAISPSDGVFRGSSAVVSLAKPVSSASADRPPVYSRIAYQAVGFSAGRGGFGGGGGGAPEAPDVQRWSRYPSSQMGAIALIRQTLIDSDWQASQRNSGTLITANALDALPAYAAPAPVQPVGAARLEVHPMPFAATLLFDATDELEVLRGIKIAREFDRPAIVLGSGLEFRRLAAIAEATKGEPNASPRKQPVPVILPLAFPRAPRVASVGDAESVELREMMTWEQAPTNPRRLAAAGVQVALTTSKARDRAQFRENLIKAIKHGLAPEKALAMVTTTPASILGVSDRLGTVEVGKLANLVVADGDLFDPRGGRAESDRPEESKPDEAKPEEAKPEDGRSEDGAAARRTARGARVRDVWIDGMRHEITAAPVKTAVGAWVVVSKDGVEQDPASEDAITLYVSENSVTYRRKGRDTRATNVRVQGPRIDYAIEGRVFDQEGTRVDRAMVEGDEMYGATPMPDGSIHWWKAKRTSADATPPRLGGRGGPARGEGGDGAGPRGEAPRAEGAPRAAPRREPDQDEKDAIAAIPEKLGYPFGPYMREEMPKQGNYLFTNATVWTVGPAGTIKDGAVYVSGGKIVFVGTQKEWGAWVSNKRLADLETIDCQGRHITPGLIDCHSHTGISRGVNEGGQAVTAEVRIQDVTDPDAISWYRQLGGGITAVNNLHGSANAIGGQNAVNKNRWGAPRPDDLHFAGAMPGIKFALGENPKWSNAGDRSNNRYPQTRMGVEALIRDRFTAAGQYTGEWAEYAAHAGDSALAGLPESFRKAVKKHPVRGGQGSASARPPRRDLELEALAEIIAGERLVHCHSYRQDEILMLCRVAGDFGFKIGTFQHILEGYKVADELAKHSLGGSCFSDWWAYKVEVQDAIPQAGPIMAEQGVVVSFNSDSDELARRMNWEAAKAIKYGVNVSPEEALAYVTLNPAKQLMIDKQVGSLEVGKDADLAVWSGPPLSAYTKCVATYVDGRRLFSLEDDAKMRETIAKERQRLTQKLLAETARGGARDDAGPAAPGGPGGFGGRRRPTMISEYYLDMMNRGFDPEMARPGECGCGWMHE
ncbi:MAG: amidohydrolase family protein [Phycisphaeraceae bacterium]|nr:amidohydrolase family protein [Phycisphaeraceae bacterium]